VSDWPIETPGLPDGYVPPSASLTPSPSPPSLRAELAEAKATIVRLEKLADRNTHTLDARSARIYQMERIVEAAVALVEFWRDQVPLEYCHDPEQDRLTDALVTAVEGGQTDG